MWPSIIRLTKYQATDRGWHQKDFPVAIEVCLETEELDPRTPYGGKLRQYREWFDGGWNNTKVLKRLESLLA